MSFCVSMGCRILSLGVFFNSFFGLCCCLASLCGNFASICWLVFHIFAVVFHPCVSLGIKNWLLILRSIRNVRRQQFQFVHLLHVDVNALPPSCWNAVASTWLGGRHFKTKDDKSATCLCDFPSSPRLNLV